MTFEEAEAWLSSFQFHGIKPGLFRIYQLLKRLNHPQKKYPAVLIAGTNGKGSTAAFLSYILRYHGLKTGLYTSPHLVSVRERFQLNHRPISKKHLAALCLKLKKALGSFPATYFELTTALAFLYFAEEGVDVAVVECGLGGRLDATNVLWPTLSIITSLGLDHQAYLGSTLSQIAWEKAGILRRNTPLVLGKIPAEGYEVIKKRAEELAAPYWVYGRDFDIVNTETGLRYQGTKVFKDLHPGLVGPFQRDNLALALKAAEILASCLGFSLKEEITRRAVSETRWPGRFEEIDLPPLIILDGAHNLDGTRALAAALKDRGYGSLNLVFAASDEDQTKPYLAMLKILLPFAHQIFICEPQGPRKPVKIETWREELAAQTLKKPVFFFRKPEEAFQAALSAGQPVLVTGSLYLVGNIRQLIVKD